MNNHRFDIIIKLAKINGEINLLFNFQNKKYYSALKIAIKQKHDAGEKARVLDIGTGTGLLSMMAAKLNADSIVACEVGS